jgi:hypothetical protein
VLGEGDNGEGFVPVPADVGPVQVVAYADRSADGRVEVRDETELPGTEMVVGASV